MQPDSLFLGFILQRKLGMVGHILREENEIDRALLLASVYGPRGMGRPKTRFIEDVVKVCAAVQMDRDRDMWRKFVKGTTVDHARPI